MLFTLFDLFDDNSSTAALSLKTESLTFIFSFESLETFDLHHEVKTFLLSKPLSLELLVLIELLVTHSDNLGVKGHLIHVLDIVVLLIELMLGIGKQALCTFILLNLNLSGWKLLGTVTIHSLHLGLASLCLGLLLSLLLLVDTLLVLLLLLSSDDSVLSHALDISLSDNCSFACRSLTSLLDVSSHCTQFIVAHDCRINV